LVLRAAFVGFRFPPDVIVVAVRWYLRFGQSYRDVEELLAERGVEVDHVTVYRYVQRFTPLLAEAARPCRHAVGDCWQVDETDFKVAGRWRYVDRAIDQSGQGIDVFRSSQRHAKAARRFFEQAISTTRITSVEVVTDEAATNPIVRDELLPRRGIVPISTPQPCRGRSRPVEGAAPADAWVQAGRSARIVSPGRPWSRTFAEPLRAGGRGVSEPASGSGVRRAGLGNLILGSCLSVSLPRADQTHQRRQAPPGAGLFPRAWRGLA
jgi:transposase-like protein